MSSLQILSLPPPPPLTQKSEPRSHIHQVNTDYSLPQVDPERAVAHGEANLLCFVLATAPLTCSGWPLEPA